jgi:chromosome partitioning protein
MDINYASKVFSPAFISRISGITPSTISRYIASNIEECTANLKVGHRKKYNINSVRKILKNLFACNFSPNKKIQVFYNFKGGTGKTTISYQVSTLLALLGFNTLVIDIDPQAHLSSSFNINPDENHLTMYDVLVNKVPVKEVIKNIFPGFDIIPSNLSLTKVELELIHMANRERVLSKVINPLKEKYDFIIIDTNPTISTLNRSAIYAADKVNIVCETQPYSLKGLEMLVDEINNFSLSMDVNIDYSIIPNKYESKTATSQEVLGALRAGYKETVMPSIVRKCEDMNISAKRKEPLCFFCGKNSYALEDIVDLTKDILENSSIKTEPKQQELIRE